MILKNLRHALKLVVQNPTFTVLAVLSLALGIGANTAIFSIVDAVLLKSLPYEDPNRLVAIYETNEELGWEQGRVAAANFLDWREQSESFSDMAAYTPWTLQLTITGTGDPERVDVGLVTGNYFGVLGVDVASGQGFEMADTWEGAQPFVVLSHDFWQRRFGGDPMVVGSTLSLSNQETIIHGILPEDFKNLPQEMDLWASFGWSATDTQSSVRLRRTHNLNAVGRLAPGVSIEQAESELESIARGLESIYPELNTSMGVGLVPLRDWLVGDTRTPLLILLGAVTLVLLIGCTNLANLLLARTAARGRELSLRTALGASRAGLMGQLMTESVVLAMLGGVFGLVVGYLLLKFFVALDQQYIPTNFDTSLDGRVLVYTFGITLLTSLVFGLVPALRSAKADPIDALKEGGTKSSGSARDHAFRDLLIVAEVALAVLLIVGSVLLLRSMGKIYEIDPGFESQGVLAFQLNLPAARYDGPASSGFYRQLAERLKSVPGVEVVGATTLLPLTEQNWSSGFTFEGRSRDQDRQATLRSAAVTPGLFDVLGLELVEGRDFRVGDDAASTPVAVVNESLVETYFSGESPLGRRLAFDAAEDEEVVWWTIVGVVEDMSQESLSVEPAPEVFRPHAQWVDNEMNVLARTGGEPLQLVGEVRRAVRDLDGSLALYGVRSLDDVVLESVGQRRFITWLMAAFALLALVQAALGIYGVVSYAANRRVREFGIRMALGAQTGQVVRLVLRHGLMVVGVGLVVGLVASLFMSRLIAQQLYSVSRFDPLTFVGVAIFLTLVGLVASYLPARRATRVDPVESLRAE